MEFFELAYIMAPILVLIALATLALGPQIPAGTLACVLVPISSSSCRSGSGGISEVYFIPYDDIDHTTGITWDSDEQATAIPLVTSKTWTKLEFEQGTASFNQEKQAVGSNLNFVQTITSLFPNNDNATRKALKAADACCDLVCMIVDNQGQRRLAGIRPVAAGGTASVSLGLKTGAGSYNTGADPSADQNLRTVTFTANSPVEAPYTTVAVSTLALTP